MDWKEKMAKGMEMMKEACEENVRDCGECPFAEQCYMLNDCPSLWNETESH